jgi:hypothetical protein
MVACRRATTTVRRPENPVNGSDARGGPADDARMTNDQWIALVSQAAQLLQADTLTSGVHLDVDVGPRVELEAVLQRQLEARWGEGPTWLPGPPWGLDDTDPGVWLRLHFQEHNWGWGPAWAPWGETLAELVVELADMVQDGMVESLWRAWPQCRQHPRPLGLHDDLDGVVVWRCGSDYTHSVPVGNLRSGRSWLVP